MNQHEMNLYILDSSRDFLYGKNSLDRELEFIENFHRLAKDQYENKTDYKGLIKSIHDIFLTYIRENCKVKQDDKKEFVDNERNKDDLAIQSILNKLTKGEDAKIYRKVFKNFGNVNLKNLNFSKANLSNVYITRNIFDGANLENVNFKKSKINQSSFIEANLTKANFNGTRLAESNLRNANLSKSSFVDADLWGTNFMGANLSGAKLTNASLIKANFSKVDLTNTDLTGANLTDTNFKEALLSKINIEGVENIQHYSTKDNKTYYIDALTYYSEKDTPTEEDMMFRFRYTHKDFEGFYFFIYEGLRDAILVFNNKYYNL